MFLFPAIDCETEENLNPSQNEPIDIEFGDGLVCVATLNNSALWNMNSDRGYWLDSNDIKPYLTINSEGNLEVRVSNANSFYKTRNPATQCRLLN